MHFIKRFLIIFIGYTMCFSVYADQAQRVSKKEATAALQLLNIENIHVIQKLCTPCGDQLPQNIVIDQVSIQDANYKGLWELVVNGQAIDLAYYYVPIKARWKNFARAVDIYVDDMPKYLDNISIQAKVEGSKGWYVNKKQKMIITKEVDKGSLVAILGKGTYQNLSVFFQASEKKGCEEESLEKSQSMPMYVNDTLVKFALLCKGEIVVFYANTEAGNDFILDQFRDKMIVRLKSYTGEEDFIFSGKGFKELYEKATKY